LVEIPSTGEKIFWRGFEFEIIDMDKHRIDKILITQKKKQKKIENSFFIKFNI